MSKKGFTLIELLVVIAIIAILAAILFPVFAKARATARKVSCLSNTRQLGTAEMMYVQDYDEKFPFNDWWNYAGCGTGTNPFPGSPTSGKTLNPACASPFTGSRLCYADSILPYVKNLQIFRCPSHPNEALGYVQNTWATPISWCCSQFGQPTNFKYTASLSQINEPANRILLGEWAVGGAAGDFGPWYVLIYQDDFQKLADAQNGSLNWTFCDGHAKAVRFRQIVNPFILNIPDDWALDPPGGSPAHGDLVGIDSNGLHFADNVDEANAYWASAPFDPKNNDL